jgi:7-carboxy-7-deazaguanine synthase (Cx14CxxC type)
MSYAVKEMFKTLQGEGVNAGRVAVLCRLSGCNLWSGREADRATATCRFCDTDFVGTNGVNGGRYEAAALAQKAAELWGADRRHRFIFLTGGEPALQVDHLLIDALHRFEFAVAIETNGTVRLPDSLDWITVSPKAGAELAQRTGQELKLVYPQPGAEPELFADLPFRHHLLQPMDGPDREANTAAAVAYCQANPKWRLSVQTHKLIGVA